MDDIEEIGEEVGEELEDELDVDRRAVIGGVGGLAALLGAGAGGYLLFTGGSGDDSSNAGSKAGSEVSGTPAPGYVESFEDGSLAAYETPSDGAGVDSKHAHHGEGALHLTTASGPVTASTRNLDSLPGAGDRFRYRFYPTPVRSDGGANVTFALDENGNGYQILCNFWKGFFGLGVIENGSRTIVGKKSVDYSGDQWYVVDVDWGQPEMTLTVGVEGGETLAELTATDDTHSAGGLSFTAWANSYQLNVFYDAVELV